MRMEMDSTAGYNNTSVHFLTKTTTCSTLYSGRCHLSTQQIWILIVINIVVSLLNLASNSFVVYKIISQNQVKHISMRLILYLSISDCFLAMVTQPIFLVLLLKPSHPLTCSTDIALQFVVVVSMRVSGYIIPLIGFDRYCRMKFWNRYTEFVSTGRMRFALTFAILLSVVQGVLRSVESYQQLKGIEVVSHVVVCIDCCVLGTVILLYVLTIRVVKKHSDQSMVSSSTHFDVERTMTKVGTRILLSVVSFYTPHLVFGFVRPWIQSESSAGEYRSIINFFVFLSYELIFLNSFTNALIFLNMNWTKKKKRGRKVEERGHFTMTNCLSEEKNLELHILS